MGYLDVLAEEFRKQQGPLVQARIAASMQDWRALSDIEQRLFGKPKETIAVASSGDIDLTSMNDLELQELKRKLQAEQQRGSTQSTAETA